RVPTAACHGPLPRPNPVSFAPMGLSPLLSFSGVSMAKKYYVVWAGRTPGIYEHWPEAERQVKGHPGARFKSFATRQQAEEASGGQAPLRTRASRSPSAKATADPSAPRADVAIYCDGACQGNPGPSGT